MVNGIAANKTATIRRKSAEAEAVETAMKSAASEALLDALVLDSHVTVNGGTDKTDGRIGR